MGATIEPRARDWRGLEAVRRALREHLVRRCRDENEVDDIVQETLLRAARYRGSLTDPERLKAWAVRIALNVLRDHVRRERRLPRVDAGDEALHVLPGRERGPGCEEDAEMMLDGHIVERKVAVRHLDGALRALKHEDRLLLGSYYGGEANCRKTAEECRISPELVKVRLFRARHRLHRALSTMLAHERHPRLPHAPVAEPVLAASGPARIANAGPAGEAPRVARGASLAGLALVASLSVSRAAPALTPSRAQCVAATSLATLEAGGREVLGEIGEDEGAPRLAGPRAQLDHARRLKAALRGREGAEREAARCTAVAAYRAVRRYFPADDRAVCEASFRAGELLRAAGRGDEAGLEFRIAAARGGSTRLGARAQLELGHVQRRAGRTAAALEQYEALWTDARAPRAQRDRAALWVGRAYAAADRAGDAKRIWSRLADSAADPLERIRAWDELVLQACAQGDPEGAAGLLEACRRELGPFAHEETRLGQRVRNALVAMRGVPELKRRIAERMQVKDGSPR